MPFLANAQTRHMVRENGFVDADQQKIHAENFVSSTRVIGATHCSVTTNTLVDSIGNKLTA